jgi:hypothetical protein
MPAEWLLYSSYFIFALEKQISYELGWLDKTDNQKTLIDTW